MRGFYRICRCFHNILLSPSLPQPWVTAAQKIMNEQSRTNERLDSAMRTVPETIIRKEK